MNRKILLSAVKLAAEMNLSETTVRRVFKKDLKLKPYKMTVQPSLTDQHKERRKRFANWIRTNFRKKDTMKILFSDEKVFDIDGVYNSQNERIWTANRMEADAKGGIKRKRKYSEKVMVLLAVCAQGVSPLIIFDYGTLDHVRYINEVLLVALQHGNSLRESLDVSTRRWEASYPCENAAMACREFFRIYIQKTYGLPTARI